MVEDGGEEFVFGDGAVFEVAYHAALVAGVEDFFDVVKAGFFLEVLYATVKVEVDEDASHIENYCFCHAMNFMT